MAYIESAVFNAHLIVVAWGNHGAKHGSRRMIANIKDREPEKTVWCLGTTKLGEPKHPLYVPYETELQTYTGQAQ